MVSSSGEWVSCGFLQAKCLIYALFQRYLPVQETGFVVAGGLWHDVPQMIVWRGDYLDLQPNVLGSEVLFSFVSICNCLGIFCVCSLKSHIQNKSNIFGVASIFMTCG